MPYYRCYFLDGDGRFADAEGFDAPDDTAAITHGQHLLQSELRFARLHGIEIWKGTDLVYSDVPA